MDDDRDYHDDSALLGCTSRRPYGETKFGYRELQIIPEMIDEAFEDEESIAWSEALCCVYTRVVRKPAKFTAAWDEPRANVARLVDYSGDTFDIVDPGLLRNFPDLAYHIYVTTCIVGDPNFPLGIDDAWQGDGRDQGALWCESQICTARDDAFSNDCRRAKKCVQTAVGKYLEQRTSMVKLEDPSVAAGVQPQWLALGVAAPVVAMGALLLAARKAQRGTRFEMRTRPRVQPCDNSSKGRECDLAVTESLPTSCASPAEGGVPVSS